MSCTTITFDDFCASGRRAAQRAATFARSHDLREAAAGTEFARLSAEASGTAETAFRCACLLARNAERMEEVAAVWKDVERVCDVVLEHLQGLPLLDCQEGKAAALNRVLDLRNAATERAALHTPAAVA